MTNIDTGHDGADDTGADYFTVHAGVALDDTRHPETGHDADELERLAVAAEAFAAQVRALVTLGQS